MRVLSSSCSRWHFGSWNHQSQLSITDRTAWVNTGSSYFPSRVLLVRLMIIRLMITVTRSAPIHVTFGNISYHGQHEKCPRISVRFQNNWKTVHRLKLCFIAVFTDISADMVVEIIIICNKMNLDTSKSPRQSCELPVILTILNLKQV